MSNRSKIWILAVLGLLVIVGVLAGIKVAQIRSMIAAGKMMTMPPESVAVTTVKQEEWQAQRAAVGSLVAVRGVMVGAELAGTVRQVAFESGAYVRQGQLLVKLDTSTEEAQLQAAQAEAALAKVNLERARSLHEGGANTPADLDSAVARAKAADAAVAQLQTAIAKKTIRAPFDGRVAIRQVELGQVVQAGTTVASLQSVSPIYAEFWMPQQALADLKVGQKARMTVDIFPGARWDGEVTTINPEVDVATRNVRVRATFGNPDGRLRPGMFANVEVLSAQRRSVLVIPATSVLYTPSFDSVFVVHEKKGDDGQPQLTVQKALVRLGERRGDFVEVVSGVKAGEQVVASGAFKLRPNMAVVVHNDLAPQAELAPKPTE